MIKEILIKIADSILCKYKVEEPLKEDEFICTECNLKFKKPLIPFNINKTIYKTIMNFETGSEQSCINCFIKKCSDNQITTLTILPEYNIVRIKLGKKYECFLNIYGSEKSVMEKLNQIKNTSSNNNLVEFFNNLDSSGIIYEIINKRLIKYDFTMYF